jgi:hypothetical protein
MNKILIFKKNELKRLIRNQNSNVTTTANNKIENKSTKLIIDKNGDVSQVYPKSKIIINIK